MRLHHVQVAIPVGGEDAARGFYRDLLGMEEIDKPDALADRGGCWFRSEEAEIHCGVEIEFQPARKAHPALEVADLTAFERRLRRAGLAVAPDALFPGRLRFYANDPFGNRVEIIGPEIDPETVRPHPFVVGACYRARREFGISAPDASFARGQVIRYVGYSGYSRYDAASVFTFEDATNGRPVELWWFDLEGIEEVFTNLEPTWCPEPGTTIGKR